MTAPIPASPLFSQRVLGKTITAHSQEELDLLVVKAEEENALERARQEQMKYQRAAKQRAQLVRELGVLR